MGSSEEGWGVLTRTTGKVLGGEDSPSLLKGPGGRLRAENTGKVVSPPSPRLGWESGVIFQQGPRSVDGMCLGLRQSPQPWEAPRGAGGQETASLWLRISQQAVPPNEGPCFVGGGCNPATRQLTHSNPRAI